jgi:hypothetical protein
MGALAAVPCTEQGQFGGGGAATAQAGRQLERDADDP